MNIETYRKISAKCDQVARKHADRQNHTTPTLLALTHVLAEVPVDAPPDAKHPASVGLLKNVRKELAGLPNDVEEIVNTLLNARTALDTILNEGYMPPQFHTDPL